MRLVRGRKKIARRLSPARARALGGGQETLGGVGGNRVVFKGCGC